jgi:KDO2-lipid IV(A) lauroyltransferase
MDTLLYLAVRLALTILQALPLRLVARFGRAGGGLAWWLDARHRRVALANLELCFGREKAPPELRAIARENFRRLGENFASAVKTASMSPEELAPHLEFVGAEKIAKYVPDHGPQNVVVAIGHFGNFELYVRFGEHIPIYRCATTYRGLRQPSLNRLMQSLRERSGCRFFERRTDAAALKEAMNGTGLLLGLLSDQHAGDRGLRLPFFGTDCSTSVAPAVLALRYHCPLHTSICYRTAPAHWRIEVGDEIPTMLDGHPRSVEDISRDINTAFEAAIRRDPANWFWVHKRWKTGKYRATETKPPAAESPGDAK